MINFRLTSEWHPDKNSAPGVQDKFVEISKAYDLLNDPDRRRGYDNYGITEDTPNFRQKHDYSQYNRFGDPFEHLQDIFGGRFKGMEGMAVALRYEAWRLKYLNLNYFFS